MNEKSFTKYLATGEYVPTIDEAPLTDLERHDRRFHPQGYKEGDKCQYRERMAAGDYTDAELVDAEREEQNASEIIEDIQTTWLPIPNVDEACEKFKEFARGYVDDGEDFLYEPLEGFEQFYVTRGRRKNELILQYFDKNAGYRENPTKNILSWRPKNVPRKKPEPSMKSLLKAVSDPLKKQAFQYFNSLININPTYATEPKALVGYLKGFNGDREISDSQVYGNELRDFFKMIQEKLYDEAVKDMGKIMAEYAESPIMARAKKDRTGMRNVGRSLDLRQNALFD